MTIKTWRERMPAPTTAWRCDMNCSPRDEGAHCGDCYPVRVHGDPVAARDAEIADLRAAVEEWLCDACNTVYPGPPQPGFACVMCPKCNGPTGPRLFIENRRLRAQLDALMPQAARYRWLRDKSEPGICAFYLSVGQAFKGVRFTPETVDSAIDAAREASKC